MKKILWFSRNPAMENQISELKRIYGEDVEIIHKWDLVKSAEDILRIYKKEKADDMVAIIPLSIISDLCEYGVHPLYAYMTQVPIEEAEITVRETGYKFVEFRRIKRLALEFYDKI